MRQSLRSSTVKWIACFLAIPLLFVPGKATPSQRQTHKSRDGSEPTNVGMAALLAAPQSYDGKPIRTIGFLSIEFEGNALYLHEEDYWYRNTKNAVKLLLSKSQEEQFKSLSLKHVLIEGTVSADKWEVERGMYNGSIGDIARVEFWRPRADIPTPSQKP